MLVDTHDPTVSRDWVHNPNSMPIEKRIELGTQSAKAARLDFDQLAIRTDQVDHESADGYLQPVPRLRQYRLDRGV
jgi:hypothetical protein